MKSTKKTVLKAVLIVIVILAALVAALLITVTVREYRPDDIETADMYDAAEKQNVSVSVGDTLDIMTWNIGYAGLSDNADFFMDGGKNVRATDEDHVNENLEAIVDFIDQTDPDIAFLQEIDQDSTRTYHIDETEFLRQSLPEYNTAFACNFRAFVPYPLPPIGSVDSGIFTMTKCEMQSSERYSLPNPFSWPIRACNLKRCLDVTRIPVEGSEHELVLINLHLEAFDDGEGKIAQTKALMQVMDDEAEAGNYVIVGGDFNQTFSNVDISAYPVDETRRFEAGTIYVDDFSDEWQFIMDPSSPTCRSTSMVYKGSDHSTFPYNMLDGFIVSSNVQVNSYETVDLDFVNSDHNPVTMNFTLLED